MKLQAIKTENKKYFLQIIVAGNLYSWNEIVYENNTETNQLR